MSIIGKVIGIYMLLTVVHSDTYCNTQMTVSLDLGFCDSFSCFFDYGQFVCVRVSVFVHCCIFYVIFFLIIVKHLSPK